MKRGDIISVATGSGFGGKPRPALVLQTDEADDLDTIIVALITSTLEEAPLSRPRIEPDSGNNLRETSEVMIDILVTARRDKVGGTIGRLGRDAMGEIDRALMVFLGLA